MFWKRKRPEEAGPSTSGELSSAVEGPSPEESLEGIQPPPEESLASPSGDAVRKVARGVVPALMVAGAAEFLRHRFQHSQMFLPEKYPTGIWEPQGYGVPAEDVWFDSADGTQLHGWWIPFKRARGTVLYCHGNAGNITNRIGVYRFLRRLRLNVLTFDYRGYGRSEGKPSETGLFQDAQAAHDFLTETQGEKASRILLFGHSLGGAVAIDLAAQRACAGLVVQSSFTDLRHMARVRFPGLPMHLITRNKFRSLSKVPHLTMPKLFIHGTSDETIPFSIGETLFEAAAEPKSWYPVPHAGHNDVYRFGGVRYLWRLVRFSRNCLSEARRQEAAAAAG